MSYSYTNTLAFLVESIHNIAPWANPSRIEGVVDVYIKLACCWVLCRIIRLVKLDRWLVHLFRDCPLLFSMAQAMKQIKGVVTKSTQPFTLVSWWESLVKRNANKICLVFAKRKFSYMQVDKISNRYARMAARECPNLRPGDTVALSMQNSPEFIFWVLGLSKLGVTVALMNTSVKGEGLEQCLKSCGASWILFSREMRPQIESLPESAKELVQFKCTYDMDGTISAAALPIKTLQKNIRHSDAALHIFTSGTTGLPKAAKISHLRWYGSSLIFSKVLKLLPTDVFYCPLPLYHSSAIILGFGLCLHNGIPFVFSKKFSAGKFWKICLKNEVTVVQYIGELCRYLADAPPCDEEITNKVRLALGNGLRADIWEKFKTRFQIGKIVEFYSSTEGNTGLINAKGKVGAIGQWSRVIAKRHPGKLLRFDYETGQPYRDSNGLCVECKPGEIGEFVGMINLNDPTQRFDGYSDKVETEKKIAKNVLKKGDRCFRSGDLMRREEDGYIYFVDRIGDTYRWKGENVSTTEVESTIGACVVKECSVYGVFLDKYEGKAGCALIKVESVATCALLLLSIKQALESNLPKEAWPVFLRFTEGDMPTTETYKYQKQELANQGFDLSREGERVFVRINNDNKFVELTSEILREITEGSFRL